MLAYFADPYPGELLYSAYARLFERMRYCNPHTFIKHVFASRHLASLVDLPSHLNYLIKTLPPGHRYSPERLINQYTLFPFYRPFLLSARGERLRQEMLDCNSNSIHQLTGIKGNGAFVPMPQTLRFCTICSEEDQECYGEPFWHRIHQIPGVEVCSTHTVFLQESKVPTQYTWREWEFITAEQTNLKTQPHSLDFTNLNHRVLLKIAQDVNWLLQECRIAPGPMKLRQQYLTVLWNQKIMTHNNKRNTEFIDAALEQYYSGDLLSLLHCNPKDSISKSWSTRLLFDMSYFSHPLHHLLLIHFLGYSVKDFFTLSLDYQPFGQGPWQCLNPAGDHYKQPTIRDCEVVLNGTSPFRVKGVFTCWCGYVYSCTNSEQVVGGNNPRPKVEAYGPIWESRLKELWTNPSLSLPVIGRSLGVDKDTVKRHAYRLGLGYTRSKVEP